MVVEPELLTGPFLHRNYGFCSRPQLKITRRLTAATGNARGMVGTWFGWGPPRDSILPSEVGDGRCGMSWGWLTYARVEIQCNVD